MGKISSKLEETKAKVEKPKIKSSTFIQDNIEKLALSLWQKNEKELKNKKFLSVKNIINMIGAGILSFTELYPSNIIKAGKPYLQDPEAYEAWKRFNIPYLKRTIKRLEEQKVVEISEEKGKQVIKITEKGKTKILKNAVEDLKVEKPAYWDGKWWLVSYDLPEYLSDLRDGIRKYLLNLGFFPIHKSVYLHAYPCKEQIEFLVEYFGIRKYMRIFKIDWIENDKAFKEYFDL